jgi:hypothetical protein
MKATFKRAIEGLRRTGDNMKSNSSIIPIEFIFTAGWQVPVRSGPSDFRCSLREANRQTRFGREVAL